MATVKEINHDSSTVVANSYTTTVSDADGAVTITPASALNGSVNGIEMDYDAGSSTVVLEEDFATLVGDDFRWRFWLNFSNMTFTGPLTSFVNLYLKSGATNIFRLQITLGFTPTTIRLTPIYYNDSGSPISGFGNLDSPQSNEFCVEIRAIRETADGNADGELELYTDGVSAGAISNVENFNRFNLGIDRARIEFLSFDNDAKGILYYDEWILDNNNTADLGCDVSALSLAAMTKPADIDAAGTFIYIALLEGGFPILTKISTALNADGTTVFNPGAGDNIGIECGRFSSDTVWVAGNFDGTNVVEKSEDAGDSFTVKDDSVFGDIRSFVMGPDSDERLLVFDETNGDILETIDDGATWTTTNSSVTPEINVIARLGENVQESVFGNDGGANNSINYSVNSGNDLEDFQTGVYPNANATRVIVN